jgi:tRNA-specific 2-thiouridylase
MTKDQVRALAAERGLPVAEKSESQDLCFVPTGDYRPFMMANRPDALLPGPMVDVDGHQIGEHQGLPLYTIGQRHGLGLGSQGKQQAGNCDANPLYVVRLDVEHNAVVVGTDASLWQQELTVQHPTFVSGVAPIEPLQVTAKVRYRSPETSATLAMQSDGSGRVRFEQAQRAITPGQAIVFYAGDEVLGGGIIGG